MEFIPVINEMFSEIDYFESNEKSGTISKKTTVTPESDFFNISEVVYNGSKVIYANEFIMNKDLLNALNKMITDHSL